MTVQISLKLDEVLHAEVKTAADEAGMNLSDWVRRTLRHEAAVAKAQRARSEEDARPPVYTPEQEAALMAARHRRAITTFEER